VIYQKIPRKWLFRLWSLWFPFLGAGIVVNETSDDLRFVQMKLKLRWWNRNYVGTQYGGSLFSMTDAIYMVMLLQNLGPGFIVWDKAATIRYLKPGKTEVTADFHVTDEILQEIRKTLETQEKMDWKMSIQIKDRNGEVIAEVDKVLYIRKKKPKV
jgi:acyl-coenzyme A thioesterase PaaI-like protein